MQRRLGNGLVFDHRLLFVEDGFGSLWHGVRLCLRGRNLRGSEGAGVWVGALGGIGLGNASGALLGAAALLQHLPPGENASTSGSAGYASVGPDARLSVEVCAKLGFPRPRQPRRVGLVLRPPAFHVEHFSDDSHSAGKTLALCPGLAGPRLTGGRPLIPSDLARVSQLVRGACVESSFWASRVT